jgi:putative transposase
LGACEKAASSRAPPTSRHANPIAPNVLDRRFAVDADVEAWVSDITYLPTRQGWLYLAIVMGLRTRQVLGCSLANPMREDLVKQALLNAYTFFPVDKGVLFHSDRGSQYAATAFAQTLTRLGFIAGMSRKGNCWDNAVTECFSLKTEEVIQPYENEIAAHQGIASYIHGFYNPHRLHS